MGDNQTPNNFPKVSGNNVLVLIALNPAFSIPILLFFYSFFCIKTFRGFLVRLFIFIK